MNINPQITQIILEIVLVAIGLYLAFYKSYFNEKGKNLATKEDITDITRMIETVKNQIYYSTHSKLSLKTEERNALVAFYERYNYWLNSSLDVSFAGIIEENKEKLQVIEDQMRDAKFSFELAKGRMQLFVKDEIITKILNDINIPTIEMQIVVQKTIGKIQMSLIETKQMAISTPLENHLESQRKILEKRSTIIKIHNDEMLKKYEEILPINKALKETIYSHLKNLIEDGKSQ